jgi:hypothetical protein
MKKVMFELHGTMNMVAFIPMLVPDNFNDKDFDTWQNMYGGASEWLANGADFEVYNGVMTPTDVPHAYEITKDELEETREAEE